LKDTVPHLPPVEGEPIPAWDLDRLVPRNCIVCRDPKHTPVCVRPDGLLVAQCIACGALFLPKVPSAEELVAFYRSYSSTKPYLQPHHVERPPHAVRIRIMFVHLARSLLRKVGVWQQVQQMHALHLSDTCEVLLRTGGLRGKTLVELGPGPHGGLLPEARQWGARAIAVEVDSAAANLVAGMGLEVHSSLASVSDPVDIFVAWHVLEHLSDPLSVVKEMARRARKGTRVLIQTQNGGQALSIGPQWIGYRVDLEHLNYFTEQTLSMELVQAGSYPECLWLTSQPILPSYLSESDRGRFLQDSRRRFNRAVKAVEDDPLQSAGQFGLTVLARFETVLP
jgi:hypothetical protein